MTFEELQKEFCGKKIAVSEKEMSGSYLGGKPYILYTVDVRDTVYLGLLNTVLGMDMKLLVMLPSDIMTMDLDPQRIVAFVTKRDGEFVISSLRNG